MSVCVRDMHECEGVLTYTCTQGSSRQTSDIFLYCLPPYFFDQNSLTEPGVLYLGWIETLSSSICLSLVGLQPQFTTLDFYMGARDLNLGTQACTASTSPSEPSPARRLSFGYS